MAKTEEMTTQIITDPETGELIEVNLDGAEQPSQTDVRSARKLHEIEGPFAILGVKFDLGKTFGTKDDATGAVTFDKEYAEFLFMQRFGPPEIGVTASGEVVASLKRVLARGLATPMKPLLTKTSQALTSAGFKVHKLERLTAAEEASLRAALKAGA